MTTTTPTPANPDQLTSAEFSALFRWIRTAKAPLRAYAMPLRPQSAGNRYANLKSDPALTTASWTPERNAKSGHVWHQITIGELAPSTMPAKARQSKARRNAAMRALLRHECAHVAHTAADFASTLVPLMRRANVPFALFNLHEDARIEALMTSTTGTPFGWNAHMSPPPAQTDNPTALFYSLIYSESAGGGAYWTGTSPADAAWIRAHYARTVDPSQTPNSAAALARAFEFAQRFALSAIELPAHRNPAAPDGITDPTHIPEPAPDAADTLAGPAPTHATTDTTNAAPHSTGGTPEDIQTALLRDLPSTFLQFARRPSERAPELGDAKRTAAELSAMARRAGFTPSRLAQSGSRIHAPAVAIGAESAFRRPSPDKGPRRLCLIVDMSGSMSYTFRDHAAAFVAAALELNRSRALQVDVWLSQSGAAAKLPAATRCEALQTLGANGSGEGLSNCMRLAAADMASASAVVVYTDGELGSDKLPRRANGSDIIGAVCADDRNAHKMQTTLRQHFDRALVSGTPHSLAREIVRYVLTRP